MMGTSSPLKPNSVRSSRSSISTSSSISLSAASGLVQKDHYVLDADLLGEEQVLPRLRHGTVRRGHYQNGAVHLRGAGDHVLDVVGVTGAVGVAVVSVLRGVLDVSDVDGDTTRLFFGCVVDLLVLLGGRQLLLGEHLRYGSRERSLTVVDVTDGADITVRLLSLVNLFRRCGRRCG
ncbi:hypothetical protein MRX96_052782 [Rhipicephalus microplus]